MKKAARRRLFSCRGRNLFLLASAAGGGAGASACIDRSGRGAGNRSGSRSSRCRCIGSRCRCCFHWSRSRRHNHGSGRRHFFFFTAGSEGNSGNDGSQSEGLVHLDDPWMNEKTISGNRQKKTQIETIRVFLTGRKDSSSFFPEFNYMRVFPNVETLNWQVPQPSQRRAALKGPGCWPQKPGCCAAVSRRASP